MVHGRSSTRFIGLVSLSVAGLTTRRLAVCGFVQPTGTPVSLQRHTSTSSLARPMSLSSPEDGSGLDKASQSNEQSVNRDVRAGDVESSSDSRRFTTDQYDGYDGAFPLPDDVEIPQTRQLRWEREALLQSKFASGDEVFELRRAAAPLHEELVDVRERIHQGDLGSEMEMRAAKGRVAELERALLAMKGKDAEFMYAVVLELLERAREDGNEELVEKYTSRAAEARLCIPQLNMHGLWVGKYGESGYDMVNITYSGDTLIATKVTGDRNVPKGKVSFSVDFSPKIQQSSSSAASSLIALEPIELNPKASQQWGKRFLPRHMGKGQVAGKNFSNAQWMEGQMILVGRFFSFAWVPLGHQVFFGRPSSELTIKMLKDAEEDELRRDHVAVMRDVAETMWDETYWEEIEADHIFAEEGCFQ